MPSPLSDIELWNAFAAGNKEAYSELFRRFYPRLFQYGMKIAANADVVEDAIQELFLNIWQKPVAQPLQSVQAYLLQALKFTLYKTFRAKGKTVSGDEAGAFELSPETVRMEKEKEDEQTRKLYSALEKLSPRQREIIYLKIYKGLSYEEASMVMGLNYQGVRNLLSQALKTFKQFHLFFSVFFSLLCFAATQW